MKKLLFIDNDTEDQATEDVGYLQNNLEDIGMTTEYVNSIRIIANFRKEDRDEMYNKIFSGEYVICTWSMYTVAHQNSMGQIISFLRAAGSAEVRDIVYIDGSGQLEESFTREFNNIKGGTSQILSAIENNYILRFKEKKIVRLLPYFGGDIYSSIFRTAEVDFLKIIS